MFHRVAFIVQVFEAAGGVFAGSKFGEFGNLVGDEAIGAAAAAANLLYEFKIPEKNDDKLTNNKKGRVILVS